MFLFNDLQMWQKIEEAEWRPQTYLELEGLPCILIFSGMDPHGESLPRRVEGALEPTPTAGGSPGQVLEGTFRILVIVGLSAYDDCFPGCGSEMRLRPGPRILIL